MQRNSGKQIPNDISYMWDLKQRNRLIRYKGKLVVSKWKRGENMEKIDEGIEKYKFSNLR